MSNVGAMNAEGELGEQNDYPIGHFPTMEGANVKCRIIVPSQSADIVALAASDKVSSYRITHWARIFTWTKQEKGGSVCLISAAAWSSDGKMLAVGHDNGLVALIGLENASCHKSFSKLHSTSVKKMLWIDQIFEKTILQEEDDRDVSSLLNYYSYKSGEILGNSGMSRVTRPQDESYQDYLLKRGMDLNLSFLVTLDSRGEVCFSTFGMLKCMIIDLERVRGEKLVPMQISFSNCSSLMSIVCAVNNRIELFRIEFPVFRESRYKIKALTFCHMELTKKISSFSSSFDKLCGVWIDATKPLSALLVILQELLTSYSTETVPLTPRGALFELITCGYMSPALAQFFSTHMKENQLGKLSQGLATTTSVAIDLALGGLVRCANEIMLISDNVRRIVSGDAGTKLLELSSELVHISESMALEIQIARVRFRDFIEWCGYIAELQVDDQGVPCPLDAQLLKSILSFLRDPEPEEFNEFDSEQDLPSAEKLIRTRVDEKIGFGKTDISSVLTVFNSLKKSFKDLFSSLVENISGRFDRTASRKTGYYFHRFCFGQLNCDENTDSKCCVRWDNRDVVFIYAKEKVIWIVKPKRIVDSTCTAAVAAISFIYNVKIVRTYHKSGTNKDESIIVVLDKLANQGIAFVKIETAKNRFPILAIPFISICFTDVHLLKEENDDLNFIERAKLDGIEVQVAKDLNGIRGGLLSDDIRDPNIEICSPRGTAYVWDNLGMLNVLDMNECIDADSDEDANLAEDNAVYDSANDAEVQDAQIEVSGGPAEAGDSQNEIVPQDHIADSREYRLAGTRLMDFFGDME